MADDNQLELIRKRLDALPDQILASLATTRPAAAVKSVADVFPSPERITPNLPAARPAASRNHHAAPPLSSATSGPENQDHARLVRLVSGRVRELAARLKQMDGTPSALAKRAVAKRVDAAVKRHLAGSLDAASIAPPAEEEEGGLNLLDVLLSRLLGGKGKGKGSGQAGATAGTAAAATAGAGGAKAAGIGLAGVGGGLLAALYGAVLYDRYRSVERMFERPVPPHPLRPSQTVP